MKTMKGFTLMELLIALVIFGVVSVGALSSFNHMVRAREQQIVHHALNQQLDLAYAHIFQDMMWFMGEVSSSPEHLSFSRTQTSHENSVVSLQYQLKEGELFRTVEDSEMEQSVRLLSGVQDLRLSWLLKNQQWVGVFDQSSLSESPLLLRLQFKTPHLGEVTWVFAAPHL